MSAFDELEKGLFASIAARAERPAPYRPRLRWQRRTLLVGAAGLALTGTAAAGVVAFVVPDAVDVAVRRIGGPRSLPPNTDPVTLRSAGGPADSWQLAGYVDVRGGLGVTMATAFDRDPVSIATAAHGILDQIAENGGAATFGVTQIAEAAPNHVVIYGAAAANVADVVTGGSKPSIPDTGPVLVDRAKAQLTDATLGLREEAGASGFVPSQTERPGDPVGSVKLFAVEATLPAGVTADDINGYVTGNDVGNGTVELTIQQRDGK